MAFGNLRGCLLLLVAGGIIGGLGVWVIFGGRLADTDRELREYRDLVERIADDNRAVAAQVGRVGDSIGTVGRGIAEAQDLARAAGVQGGSITDALKKLVGNLKALQAGIADLEGDYDRLRSDYARLRGLVGPGELVDPEGNGL